jgi:IPT/TIG domain
MSDLRSVNEPQTTRTTMLTPQSINEPLALPELEPTIAAIEPTEATIGDASFTLYVAGTNFFPGSVIMFAGNPEPTTLENDGTLSTGVDMSVWHGPDTLPVLVMNGDKASNEVSFTFHEADSAPLTADPDDLEDEIEQAGEEGDFRPLHASKPTKGKAKKR